MRPSSSSIMIPVRLLSGIAVQYLGTNRKRKKSERERGRCLLLEHPALRFCCTRVVLYCFALSVLFAASWIGNSRGCGIVVVSPACGFADASVFCIGFSVTRKRAFVFCMQVVTCQPKAGLCFFLFSWSGLQGIQMFCARPHSLPLPLPLPLPRPLRPFTAILSDASLVTMCCSSTFGAGL